jgi:hypothetical protein
MVIRQTECNSVGRELSASLPLAISVWRSSHWSSTEVAAGPSILAALVCALRQAVLALVNAATPVPVIVTDIARPVGEISATLTYPLFCIRARFRLTVDRSAISLVARAAGLTGPAAVISTVRISIWASVPVYADL